MAECITMRANDCLKGVVKREYHTRKRGVYVLEDKHEQYLVLAQKLPHIVTFLNSIASDDASRVSLTALYQIQGKGKTDNKVGGYAKHRWRLRFAAFEDVCRLFEHERGRFLHALIVGEPDCYQIETQG